jgi:lysozyme
MKQWMGYSQSGYAMTKHFECCRLAAYFDELGKVWTIGWGHTRNVKEGDTCTQQQADDWLVQDVSYAVRCVNVTVDVQLSQPEFDALCDFVFNLGCHRWFGSTLHRLVNQAQYGLAAAEFEKWDHSGAKVVAGLLKRRDAELEFWNTFGTEGA